MHALHKANQTSAAANNRRLIIQLLRQQPLSRSELASRTGLRSSTLTDITRELLNLSVVRTVGKRSAAGVGRKQELLEINPDLGWVLGVGLEGDSASITFLDAAGGVIDRDRLDLGHDVSIVPAVLQTRVEAWLRNSILPPDRLLGIGVGVPGIVDHRSGMVLRSRWFDVENYDLSAALQEAFQVPVSIDNDANLAAYAESCIGSGVGADNCIYLLVNAQQAGRQYAIQGLGATFMLGGRLHRGARFAAGEIDNLIDRPGDVHITAHDLLELAKPAGRMTPGLERLCERLSGLLAVLVDLIDPELIVFVGNAQIANEEMLATLSAGVERQTIPVAGRRVALRAGALLDHGVTVGAAIAAMDRAMYDDDGVVATCVAERLALANQDASLVRAGGVRS